MKPWMWGLAAALLSGAVLAVSRDTGHYGWLVLIGPVPLLVYALRQGPGWQLLGLSALTGLMGGAGPMYFYGHVLPLIYGIALFNAVVFAVTVLFMAALNRSGSPALAVAGFAVMTAGWEYLYSLISPNGTFNALGYALVDVLPLLQVASVGGMAALSFVAAIIPAGLAALIVVPRERAALAVWAMPVVAALGFGLWSLSQPRGETVRVAVISDDRYVARTLADPQANPEVTAAFAVEINKIAAQKPAFVVLPEKMFASGGAFQSLADRHGVTIVAGIDGRSGEKRLNAATVFAPGAAARTYLKRHMVPVLEGAYAPGDGALVMKDTGIAICKDMDFPATLRQYHGAGLLLVPAWDFVRDARLHGRMAVVRGVENGFAIARSASEGLMTVSDAQGRIVAEASSRQGPAHVIADVPPGPGRTMYGQTGDVFAWIMLAGWAGLLLTLFVRKGARSVRAGVRKG